MNKNTFMLVAYHSICFGFEIYNLLRNILNRFPAITFFYIWNKLTTSKFEAYEKDFYPPSRRGWPAKFRLYLFRGSRQGNGMGRDLLEPHTF